MSERAGRGTVIRGLARAFTRIPALGRLWARTAHVVTSRDVPWTPLTRTLRECTATLITTGGVHLRGDVPFDMTNPHGDPSFREIPAGAVPGDLTITHDYYDHRDADRDPNIVFPLERFRELVRTGVLAGVTPTQYSFMGHVDGPLVETLTNQTVPALVSRLRQERPSFAFVTPA